MMEERKENDFKMDTEDLRLLNAFGEALGDLPSEEETRAAWNAFTSRQDAQKRRRIIQMWTSGIAAAIVVLVVLIVPRITNEDTIQDIEIFAALDVPEAIITSESNGRITLSTPPATTTQIILDDGTQVTLNANSRLEYPKQFPAEGTREVHLTGEARFEVAKDSARPFIVSSGKMQTQVLGTVFDVNAYPGKVAAVTLFQGRVRVSDEKQTQQKDILPGQQAILSEDNGFTISEAQLTATEGWTKGEFSFDDAELAEIMKSVGTWYNTSIIFHSPDLLKQRIHFRFPRTTSLEEVVQALNDLGIAKLEQKKGKSNHQQLFSQALIRRGRAFRLFPLYLLFYCHSRTASGYHQHTTASTYSFIVQIHANHSIGSESSGVFLHFTQGDIFRFAQHFLIRAATSAHYIADTGKKVTEYIGTDNRLA